MVTSAQDIQKVSHGNSDGYLSPDVQKVSCGNSVDWKNLAKVTGFT